MKQHTCVSVEESWHASPPLTHSAIRPSQEQWLRGERGGRKGKRRVRRDDHISNSRALVSCLMYIVSLMLSRLPLCTMCFIAGSPILAVHVGVRLSACACEATAFFCCCFFGSVKQRSALLNHRERALSPQPPASLMAMISALLSYALLHPSLAVPSTGKP